MKTPLLFLLLVSLSLVNAQTSIKSSLAIKSDTFSVPKYKAAAGTDLSTKTLLLTVNFGEFAFNEVKEIEGLNTSVITNVDLVYTKYPEGEDFTELNRKRIEYLHLMCPGVFSSNMTKWRIIAQTGCKNVNTAKKYFHGFVITYRPGPTAESFADEVSYIKSAWKHAPAFKDSTVIKTFQRNKWKHATVVCDFTGSMAPYIAQTLIWYKLTFQTKDISEFVFFNDGDETPNYKKKIGKTGGVYYSNTFCKDSVLKTAYKCLKGGYGGDVPENNIEACLFAIKNNPKIKEIVMIADNWAPMRDYSMLSAIKVPVHIILCGINSEFGINPQYLDLARQTNGTVHTLEQDISKLSKVAEGQTIEINGATYKILAGRFIKVTKNQNAVATVSSS
ncbi:MAG: hypothetical protein JST67_05310 [Bacteroidetes bacterium]|nr:hypothetical protein [Bacteroidota bacterium]